VVVTALFGFVLAQAPGSLPVAPAALVNERELGKAFVLRSSHFLQWRPVRTFVRGWDVALAEVWRIEVIPTDPRFSRMSFSVESSSFEEGIGMIRPRFEVAVHEEFKLAVEAPMLAAFSSAGGALLRGGMPTRPGFLLSGRF